MEIHEIPDGGALSSWPLPWGEAAGFSTRNPEKEVNEDAAAIVSIEDAALLLVVDGMGGQSAGREASRITLKNVLAQVRRTHGSRKASGKGRLRHALLDGIDAANREVMALGIGAGATLAAVLVEDDHARTVHVGDAFALHVGQRGRLKAATISHSPTGYAVEAGLLDEREALHHEERHLVLNHIGDVGLRIELGPPLRIASRDTLLVASDGLTDNLTQDEVVNIVRKGPLEGAGRALSDLAGRRMLTPEPSQPSKPDDLTFVICRPAHPAPRALN